MAAATRNSSDELYCISGCKSLKRDFLESIAGMRVEDGTHYFI